MKAKHSILAVLSFLCFILFSCDKDEEDKTDIITFEELDLGSEGYWNGSDGSGGFTSGNAFFPNQFTDWGNGITSWKGFAYSNHTDIVTPGYVNQYSSYAGGGANGSEKYAVIYGGIPWNSLSLNRLNQFSFLIVRMLHFQ